MSYADDQVNLNNEALSYGGIPYDMLMRKMQTTNMYEDPMAVENYMRSLLVDFRPDKPFFASDEIRHPDDIGGGTHSREKLNLRHGGARSLEDPYLPDGTFLDHEFTERDPRGHAIGPNMRKHVDQQFARAAFIKFYPDSDYSVPEQGIAPERMVSNIKSLMYQFKDRFANFDESFDGWHNGGTGYYKRLGGSDVAKYTMDGTIMDLVDAEQGNRTDAVARLSADPKVAYRHSTVDHRFKITRYGAVRANQYLKDNNWTNNRRSVFSDHPQSKLVDGVLMNRQLANLIIDLEGLRQTKQEVAKGANFGDSYNNLRRNKKIHPDDIYKWFKITGSQVAPDHQLNYEGKLMRTNRGTIRHNNRALIKESMTQHYIAASMEQATKKLKERAINDLRQDVLHTIMESRHDENINRNMQYKADLTQRNAEDNRYIEASKEIVSYAGIKPSKDNRVDQLLAREQFGEYSLAAPSRASNRYKKRNVATDDQLEEQDRSRLDFGVFDRAERADPRDHMMRDYANLDIGDGGYGQTVNETDLQKINYGPFSDP